MREHARRIADRLAPLLGLVLVVVVFTIWGAIQKPDATFLGAYRATLIAKQSAIVGMGAIGMTAIVVSGGIDLSAGALVALCTVILAKLLNAGVAPVAAVALTLCAGACAGLSNGLLVTRLRLAPFLATLGTMLVFRGLAEEISDLQKIAVDVAPRWLGALLDPPARGSLQLLAGGVWLLAACAALLAFVLARTVFGRHVVAVGSNEAAARLCGVPIERTKLCVYALGGLCFAGAALFQFADLNAQGDPTSSVGLELHVIAAVVIGGASLSGGRGSVLGSLVGALFVATLQNGCAFVELGKSLENVLTGVIILGAVALDRVRRRREP